MALGPTSARDRQERYMTGTLRYDEAQSLNSGQRTQARANIGAPGTDTADAVTDGLMASADKVFVDALKGGNQTELNTGTATTRRSYSAALLWTWLQNRVRALFNVSGNAPMYAVRAFIVRNIVSGSTVINKNFSSITNIDGTSTRFTFDTNMPDANYCVLVSQQSGNNSPGNFDANPIVFNRTAGGFSVFHANRTNNVAILHIAVLR